MDGRIIMLQVFSLYPQADNLIIGSNTRRLIQYVREPHSFPAKAHSDHSSLRNGTKVHRCNSVSRKYRYWRHATLEFHRKGLFFQTIT